MTFYNALTSMVLRFLLQIVCDLREDSDVRTYVIKLPSRYHHNRASVAYALMQVTRGTSPAILRNQSIIALSDFTDIDGAVSTLESVALDGTETLELRYSAYTLLERAGPTPQCADILRRLALDETLGPCANSLLSSWKIQ